MTATATPLSYLHECAPPPIDPDLPGRHRWYCDECGTPWQFVRPGNVWRTVERTLPRTTLHVVDTRRGKRLNWTLAPGDTVELGIDDDGLAAYVIKVEEIR